MKNKEIFNDNDKRIIKEIMNIMVPENQEIKAAGDKGLFNEMEKIFFDSEVHVNSFRRILDAIHLNIDVRLSGSLFSLTKENKIEILKNLEKNMYDEFQILKESIFGTYYSDSEVLKKIGWDNDFINKTEAKENVWNPKILEKVKKIEPFWKKI